MKRVGLATIALFVVLVSTAPASAHDDDGKLAVTSAAQPSGELSVAYTVRVTYANDGHGAKAATVTAVALDGTGQQVGPVTLVPGPSEGDYGGSVTFPTAGSWTVRFSSLSPLASSEIAQVVAPTPTTAPSPTPVTTVAPLPSTTSSTPSPTVPAATTPPTTTSATAAGTVVFVAIVVVILGAGGLIVLVRRRGDR